MRALVLSLTVIFSSTFAQAALHSSSDSEPLKLVALCESFNGDSYLAVWVRGENYTVEYTDDLDLGDTDLQVTQEAIKIESLLTWEPIVIPAGRNVVDIAGSSYNCDY